MKHIDCDSHIGMIFFDDNSKWDKIPISEWERLMDVMLSPSIRTKYFETDYVGFISDKRYKLGKIYYQNICKIFRLNGNL